ncbi:MAG: DNA-processing protein DprA, partial [Proteobacteria bacterium]|nr:DNA-processing protein DprA [Pseudomonadota bacterium]
GLNISVVGPRKTSGSMLKEAYFLAFQLSGSNVTVVSGLAEGIDRSAHRGALDGCGYTIGVSGCGPDLFYPPSGRDLVYRILDSGGVVLGEYPPGTPPLKNNFPERNRIVSGLSEAVVVAGAPAKSGSLITADFALEQGRDLFVLGSSSGADIGLGSRDLIDQGAPLIDSASPLLKMMSHPVIRERLRFTADSSLDSGQTGKFLAERVFEEMRGREVSDGGVFYRL